MKPIYLKPDQSVVFVAPKDPKINGWGDKMYIENPPYLPGEKCYVRETWYCENENTAQDIMSRGQGIYYKSSEEHPEIFPYWRSPVTMPAWAARRFVTVVSCEPIQQDGKLKWRVEVKEVKG